MPTTPPAGGAVRATAQAPSCPPRQRRRAVVVAEHDVWVGHCLRSFTLADQAGKCQRGASAEGAHRSTCDRWKRQVDRWGLEALNIASAVGPHLEQRPVASRSPVPGPARGASAPSSPARSGAASGSLNMRGVAVSAALGLNRLILNIVGRTLSSLASSRGWRRVWRAATALPRQLASTRPASRRTPCRPEHARPSPACGSPGSSRRPRAGCRRRGACGHVGARRRIGRHPDVRVPSSRFVITWTALARCTDYLTSAFLMTSPPGSRSEWRRRNHARRRGPASARPQRTRSPLAACPPSVQCDSWRSAEG